MGSSGGRSMVRCLCTLGIVSWLVACSDRHTSIAKDVTQEDSFREAVKAAAGGSDRSGEETVRELLQLQQQLGGSIVDGRPQLEDLQHLPEQHLPMRVLEPRHHTAPQDMTLLSDPLDQAPVTQQRSSSRLRARHAATETKVDELREAAWNLDGAAHRLEHLDLYEQADALRSVAARLRRDARLMKQRGGSLPRQPGRAPAADPRRSHRIDLPRR